MPRARKDNAKKDSAKKSSAKGRARGASCKPLVSVVMPVYNAAKHLDRMLAALASQTLKDIEIICVDDGSTDDSLKICERCAADDGRFVVVSQKNAGAAVARNRGLSEASGEWVFFGDADDDCEPEMLASMVAQGEKEDADVVAAGRYVVNTVTGDVYEVPVSADALALPQPVSPEAEGVNVFRLGLQVWNKLYRRSFVVKYALEFHQIATADDVYFVATAYALAKRISLHGKSYYRYYMANPGSQMGRAEDSPASFLDALREIRDFYQERTPEGGQLQRQCYAALVKNCFDSLFIRRTSHGIQATFAALRDGGLDSLAFPKVKGPEFCAPREATLYSLIASGSPLEVLQQEYVKRLQGTQELLGRRLADGRQKEAELKRQIQEKTQKGAEVWAQRCKFLEERNALSKKLEEQRAKGAEMWAQRCKFLEEREALRKKVEEQRAKGAEIWAQRCKFQEEREALRKKVEEQRAKGAEIWAQRCKFQEERDALRTKVEEQRAKGAEIWAQRCKFLEERESLRQKVEEQRAKCAEIWAQRCKFLEERESLRQKLEEQRAKGAEVWAQRCKFQEERDALRQKVEEQRAKGAEIWAQRCKFQEEREALRKKVEEQRAKGAEIWAQRCKFLEERNANARQIHALEGSLGAAKDELSALKDEISVMREDMSLMENVIAGLRKEVETLEKEESDILASADYKVGHFLVQPFHLLGRLFRTRG